MIIHLIQYLELLHQAIILNKFLNEGELENCSAIDGGCALHIKNGIDYSAIVFKQKKNAYLVKKNGELIIESPYLREEIF